MSFRFSNIFVRVCVALIACSLPLGLLLSRFTRFRFDGVDVGPLLWFFNFARLLEVFYLSITICHKRTDQNCDMRQIDNYLHVVMSNAIDTFPNRHHNYDNFIIFVVVVFVCFAHMIIINTFHLWLVFSPHNTLCLGKNEL